MLNIDTGIIRERHPNGTVLCAFVKNLSEDEAKFAAETNIKEIVIDYGESYYRVHRNKKNEVTKIVKYIRKIEEFEIQTIGMSDKACLAMQTVHEVFPKKKIGGDIRADLPFGEDGVYTAKVYRGKDKIIPVHYSKVYECAGRLRIIDDCDEKTVYEADHIEVYRAGEFGCAIKLWNN